MSAECLTKTERNSSPIGASTTRNTNHLAHAPSPAEDVGARRDQENESISVIPVLPSDSLSTSVSGVTSTSKDTIPTLIGFVLLVVTTSGKLQRCKTLLGRFGSNTTSGGYTRSPKILVEIVGRRRFIYTMRFLALSVAPFQTISEMDFLCADRAIPVGTLDTPSGAKYSLERSGNA